MHELSVCQAIVAACSERAGDAGVIRVTVEIGSLSCVMADALRFCFDIATQDTPLAGAELEIIRIPGISQCRACGREVVMHDLLARCDCGSGNLSAPSGGDELRIKSMEIEEAA